MYGFPIDERAAMQEQAARTQRLRCSRTILDALGSQNAAPAL